MADETTILLLLSDSNLPTGSFVASSGLESFLKHGFGFVPSLPALTTTLSNNPGTAIGGVNQSQSPPTPTPSGSSTSKAEAITTFIRDSLSTYAPSALPFVSDAHYVVSALRSSGGGKEAPSRTLELLKELDALYEAMTLNHVARRASKAQGVALLSLYSKGFSHPPGLGLHFSSPSASSWNANATASDGRIDNATNDADTHMSTLVDTFKLAVRCGDTDAHGHLPVCWGVLCAALGLSLARTQHLHLYLHARSLLSAAVRLNTIGPYAAQQILLHVGGALVNVQLGKCARLRTGVRIAEGSSGGTNEEEERGWDETTDGPATTWPLGEILAARHDLQHSRIFNS
ncbi:UreF-domain-containing protein [Mycena alexandri]|uniref:UreF-domain-containing protein n=1 Tax=Mycena alexandri TaxID=1745969 RepID=A0AAD6XE49_9AGAR|nr:UreF-domain-containing protein [Mycena alexandri]